MADIHLALRELWHAEFNNNPDKFLHKNSGENGYTLGGVYQVANPTQIDWAMVQKLVDLVGTERASRMLYFDTVTMEKVQAVFYNLYWSKLRLNEVNSQKIANEIFLFAVVSGVKNGAKVAQRLVGVVDDGIVGPITISALNDYNENAFDVDFDKMEIAYFEALVEKREDLMQYLEGWKNRAEFS